MTKKKRSLFIVLGVVCVCVLSCAFVLTGCGNKHKFSSDEWTYDETYHWHQCTKHEDDADDVEDKATHTFVDVEDGIITEATCGTVGEKKVVCSVCGYESTEEIPVTGEHTAPEATETDCFVWNWETASEGKVTVSVKCAVCGVVMETLEGTYTATTVTAAACETEGEETWTGTAAYGEGTINAEYTATIPATGHSYDTTDITWDWTDYTACSATVTCTACGDELTVDAVITSSEDETTDDVTYTATATIEGIEYKDTKIEYAHTHEYTQVPAKDAKCEEAGNEEYYTCKCGKVFTYDAATETYTETTLEAVTILATGHSYVVSFGEWEAETATDGTLTYTPTVTVACKNGESEVFSEGEDYTVVVTNANGVYTATVYEGATVTETSEVLDTETYTPTGISLTVGSVELSGVYTWTNTDSLYIVRATADSNGNVTYVLGGTASVMDAAQGEAFWPGYSAKGDAYIVITVTFGEDDTVSWTSSAGDTRTKSKTNYADCTFAVVVRISGYGIGSDKAEGKTVYTITDSASNSVTYTVDFSGVTIPEPARLEAPAGTVTWQGVGWTPNEGITFSEPETQENGTIVYKVTGVASDMSADQANVYWADVAKEGDLYIYLEVLVKPGETLTWSEGEYPNETQINDYGCFIIGIYSGTQWSFTISSEVDGGTVSTTYVVDFTGITNLPKVKAITSAANLETAFAAGGSYELRTDIVGSFTVSATVSLDLAGYSITSDGTTITVASTGSLTVTDSAYTETSENGIVSTYTNTNREDGQSTSEYYAGAIATTGTLVIESGNVISSSIGILAEGGVTTIKGGSVSSDYFSIFEGAGTVTVNIIGGTVSGTRKGIAVCGDSAFGYWEYDGNQEKNIKQYQDGAVTTLNVSGGIIYCQDDSPICTLGEANYTSAIINITGGVIYRADTENGTPMPAIYAPSATLTISGGTIEGPTAVEIRGGHVTISGGTFISNAQGDASDGENENSGAKTYGYAVAVYPYGKVTRDGAHTDENVTEVKVTDNEVLVSIAGGTFTGAIYVRAASERANWDYESTYRVTIEESLGLVGTAYDSNGGVATGSGDIVYTLYESGSSTEGDDDEGNNDDDTPAAEATAHENSFSYEDLTKKVEEAWMALEDTDTKKTYETDGTTPKYDKFALSADMFDGDNSFISYVGTSTSDVYRDSSNSSCIEIKGSALQVTFEGTGTLTITFRSNGTTTTDGTKTGNTSTLALIDENGNYVQGVIVESSKGNETVVECQNEKGYFYAVTDDAGGSSNFVTITFTITTAGTYTIASSIGYYADNDTEKQTALDSRATRIGSIEMVDYYVDVTTDEENPD